MTNPQQTTGIALTGGVPSAQHLVLAKYEGAGNDFLVVADEEGHQPLQADMVRRLCHRRYGVGADGVLRLSRSTGASDLAMELRNADGSVAEMSGNGIRCLVHAAVDLGWVAPGPVVVDTVAGERHVQLALGPEPGAAVAQVDMGRPRLLADGAGAAQRAGCGSPDVGDLPANDGEQLPMVQVDMGNPHLVVLVPSVDPEVVARWGAAVDKATPGGTNVELVRVIDRQHLQMGVWERGAGTTLACGTGSCAAATAGWAWGVVDDPVVVENPGGPLSVSRRGGAVVLSGPSRRVATVLVDRQVLAFSEAAVGRHVQ